MWYSRMTLAAVLICLLAGCTKSNPLIGKWKLAPKAAPVCGMFDGIEFSEKTMTVNVLGRQTAPVTYGRDGDHYLANGPNGTMAFEKNSDGIKSVAPVECQLIPET